MSKDTRASRPATVLYQHPRKPVESKEERKRAKESLTVRNIYGGGNDAS